MVHREGSSRRQFLTMACACCGITVSTAGCLDGNGDDGGNGGSGEEYDGDFEEFDPSDQDTWYPQLTSTYLDEAFETGAIEELDDFEQRDEPHYGDAPPETPDDEGEWIDPEVIDFAMTPTEDPAIFQDALDPLIENLEEETGREVNYTGLQSNAAQIEAMRAGRLHVAGFSTGPTPFAVNLAGAVPFSIQVGEDSFGYRLWLITQADNEEINELADLEGRTVAHTDPSSNSGHLAPNAMFTEMDIVPDEDYEVEFSGSHENSATGIYHGDYEAAPICSTCYARVARRGDVEAGQIKSVWASAPFPTTSFNYSHDLHPDLQEGVRRAFLDYDYQGTILADEFEDRGTFVEIDYATHWHDILVNHEINGVEYDLEEAD